jgi:hypothetical protein
MSKNREVHFSLIEFRPDPSDSKRDVEWLGVALEFTTPSYWIVGLAMRATLDSDTLSKLDPMSRELLEKRSDVMEAEIKQILPRASRTGDVLRLLAHNNQWSVHVSEPQTMEIKDDGATKDHSIEQMLEEYIFKLWSTPAQRPKASHKPKTSQKPKATEVKMSTAENVHPTKLPLDVLPGWMLPPQYWSMPRLDSD